jgi:hypothetical protein
MSIVGWVITRLTVPTLTRRSAAIQAKPLKTLARMGIIRLDHPAICRGPVGVARSCLCPVKVARFCLRPVKVSRFCLCPVKVARFCLCPVKVAPRSASGWGNARPSASVAGGRRGGKRSAQQRTVPYLFPSVHADSPMRIHPCGFTGGSIPAPSSATIAKARPRALPSAHAPRQEAGPRIAFERAALERTAIELIGSEFWRRR